MTMLTNTDLDELSYLDEALELQGVELEEWLANLHASKPAMAARVSDSLNKLAELKRNRFLEPPAAATLRGQRLGAYTLDRCIGHGGMGTVWLGHRSDGQYQGKAAIKLLNAAIVAHPAARRFRREGNVLARLQHPNIAQLFDAGVASTGQPYLVLEYIEGECIDEYCRERALDCRQRVTLFLDVLAAVAHAHSNLIVHRDLKPSNILVTRQGVVKLLDFGVAALLAPERGSQTTVLGASGLTPGYAAPEQLLGGAISTATDVYALGMLLFVLLAGTHPLAGRSLSQPELVKLMLETEMPLASSLGDDTHRRKALRGELDNIIAMALRHNPTERYSTVQLLVQDLRRYLACEPVLACSPSLRYRASKFVRRHRAGVAAALALVTALIGGITATTWQMLEAQRQAHASTMQARRAESDGEFVSILVSVNSCPDYGIFRPGDECSLRMDAVVNKGIEVLEQRHADDPAAFGRLLLQFTQYAEYNTSRDLKLAINERAYQLGIKAKDTALSAVAQCNTVIEFAFRKGELSTAQRRLADARRLAGPRWALGLESPACLTAEALVQTRLGNLDAAASILRKGIAATRSRNQTRDTQYPMLLLELARVYAKQGHYRELLETSLQLEPAFKAAGLSHPNLMIDMQFNVTVSWQYAGELQAALRASERFHESVQKRVSVDGVPSVVIETHSDVLLGLGRTDEAARWLKDSLERARADGSAHRLMKILMSNIELQQQQRDWAACLALLSELEVLFKDNSTASERWPGWIALQRAEVAFANGQTAQARAHVASALTDLKYGSPQPHPTVFRALLVASQIALKQGSTADAETFATDALSRGERQARSRVTSAYVGEALLRLAQARLAAGKRTRITPLLERAVRCLDSGYGADHKVTREARQLLRHAGV